MEFMKKISCLLSFTLFSFLLSGQASVSYSVDPSSVLHNISPYIYGVNEQSVPMAQSRRLGGNRLTGYNWETNHSNAGEDYFNNSDYYLPWIAGIDESEWSTPGIVLSHFIDDCNEYDQYSLVTLPMAGFVAADADGEVMEDQTAPSIRWQELLFDSGNLLPDVDDNAVYVDQEIDFLIEAYGQASSDSGVRAYSLDNEPALWPYTHPRLHPEFTTVEELLTKSINLSQVIKSKDAASETFGPALYGFYAYYTLQDAPDWWDYADEYETFIDVYLDEFRTNSETSGQRLLDVLDVHWYPEPAGVYVGNTDEASNTRRINAPRSLWDESYTEESWIAEFLGAPIQIIPRLQQSIDTYYPGTKLGITEYDYGASDHISGGVAQVEALGAFAMNDVYIANKWGDVNGFIEGAYQLYLDYDGNGSQFGEEYISSTSSNIDQSSIFSSIDNDDKIHMVITNRNLSSTISAEIIIEGSSPYEFVNIYKLTQEDTIVQSTPEVIEIVDNAFSMMLDPLSAYHIVAAPMITSLDEEISINVSIQPNPVTDYLIVRNSEHFATLEILDINGQLIKQVTSNQLKTTLNVADLTAGTYLVIIRDIEGNVINLKKFIRI